MKTFEKTELDLVDFETAVELAERDCLLISKKSFVKVSDNQYYTINNIGFPPNMYPRPELELVSKWLMDNKDINITIILMRRENGHASWYFNIDHIKVDKILHRWHPKDPVYDKYEDALLEGIKFSLTLIPKNIKE